ncbi:transmembrane protein, putative [Medicago truncatula]|uniref:Transmembrane protein, putative n=1 Tax=Medicago truncatula TaxID=3880 RepID=G7K7T3_MEDTR|nr:transmembrane protein, putative [Medicago truncatula]
MDNWVGGALLCVRLSGLFDLIENPWCLVVDMLGWNEKEVLEVEEDVVCVANVSDGWKWLLDLIKGYSVSGVSQLFMVADEPPDQGAIDDIWLRQVPLIDTTLFLLLDFFIIPNLPFINCRFFKKK